jgi:iron complex outermembrane receptor protein
LPSCPIRNKPDRKETDVKPKAHPFPWPAFTASAAAFVAAALAPAAAAQETTESTGLEEVTVTARFREEPLQRTPLAITAISGDALELRGATNVVDIGKYSPNVTINPLGAGYGPTLVANIRGIGLTDFKPVFEPGVPIYIDDVVLARSTGAILDLLDLERVEVLRGPQGTLFGKNAAGGAIRMVSRKPTGDGPAFIEGTVGDFDRIDFRGAFESTLIADKAFARFSFSSKKRDGYIDVLDFPCQMALQGTPELAGTLPRDTSRFGSGSGCKVDELGDENVEAARVALRFVPSDRLEFNLTGDISDESGKSQPDKTLQINPALALLAGVPGLAGYNPTILQPRFGVSFDERFITNDPFTTYASFEDPINGLETPNISEVTHWGIHGTLDFDLTDTLALKAIIGHRKFDAQFGRDSDGSPLPINHTFDRFVHTQDSYELRLSGSLFAGRTDWTFGGFKFEANDFQPNYVILYPGSAALAAQSLIDRIDEQDSDNWAVFAHTVNRLTDAFTLTAGVRYTKDEKSFHVIRAQQLTGAVFLDTTVDSEASRTTPMVSLAYSFTDDVNSYVSWQRGFRGGGFNPRPANAAQVTSFNPEDLDSYEVGLKTEWFNRSLRANVAAFYVKYEDLQLPSVFVSGNSVTFPPLNAGKAHMQGVELEFQGSPGGGFSFDGSVGYLDFEYDDLGAADPEVIRAQPNLTPAQREQNARAAPCRTCRPLRTPEWTANLGLQYQFPITDHGRITLRADGTYQARVFYSVNNFFRASQPAYTLLDASIGWTSQDESWRVLLSGSNLTDELYLNGALDFFESLGQNEGNYGRPREWAISVRRNF